MSHRRTTAVLLAGSLFLAFAIPADVIGFHPKADLELKKELDVRAEIKPTKLEFTVNGEPVPADEMGSPDDSSATVHLKIGATDKYVQTKDGRPTDLLRTFDSLQLSYEAGEEKGDAPKFDALEGKTVRFKWNGDSDSYEKSLQDGKGDAALLDQLSEDMDFRMLLPSKKVAEGDAWEIAGDKLVPLFLPGGMPGEIASGDDKDEVKTALEEVRSSLAKFQEDLKIQCKYKGARDEGDARVAEIDFTFAAKGKADVSHLVERLLAMEENDVHPDADANADIDLSGGGVLLWHLAEGRVHSFTMHAEAGIDLDAKSSFDVEGENIQLVAKGHVAAKSAWTLTASKP